jgi:phage terminase large subunit-like protein
MVELRSTKMLAVVLSGDKVGVVGTDVVVCTDVVVGTDAEDGTDVIADVVVRGLSVDGVSTVGCQVGSISQTVL